MSHLILEASSPCGSEARHTIRFCGLRFYGRHLYRLHLYARLLFWRPVIAGDLAHRGLLRLGGELRLELRPLFGPDLFAQRRLIDPGLRLFPRRITLVLQEVFTLVKALVILLVGVLVIAEYVLI